MVTIDELKKSIEEERKKVKAAQEKGALIIEKSRLKKELFQLRNQKSIASVGKVGRFIRSQARKAAPVIQKQVKLIRQQQLRDDAIARKQATLKKRLKKKKPSKKINQDFSGFPNLDF